MYLMTELINLVEMTPPPYQRDKLVPNLMNNGWEKAMNIHSFLSTYTKMTHFNCINLLL